MRVAILVLVTFIIFVSCDDRCGDKLSRASINNDTPFSIKIRQFHVYEDVATIQIPKHTQHYSQVRYTPEDFRYLDSVVFENSTKRVVFKNEKYEDVSLNKNHYFNVNNWTQRDVCKGIATSYSYTINEEDFD